MDGLLRRCAEHRSDQLGGPWVCASVWNIRFLLEMEMYNKQSKYAKWPKTGTERQKKKTKGWCIMKNEKEIQMQNDKKETQSEGPT